MGQIRLDSMSDTGAYSRASEYEYIDVLHT